MDWFPIKMFRIWIDFQSKCFGFELIPNQNVFGLGLIIVSCYIGHDAVDWSMISMDSSNPINLSLITSNRWRLRRKSIVFHGVGAPIIHSLYWLVTVCRFTPFWVQQKFRKKWRGILWLNRIWIDSDYDSDSLIMSPLNVTASESEWMSISLSFSLWIHRKNEWVSMYFIMFKVRE